MPIDEELRKVRGRSEPLSVQQYLDLRSQMSAEEIDVWNENGIDWMFWWESAFDDPFGITQMEVRGWLDCVPKYVSSTSLKVLKAINERELAEQRGETHLAARGFIEDSFVATLLSKQLEMMDWNKSYFISKDFLFLLRVFLKADDSKYISKLHSYTKRQSASFWALNLKISGRPVTVRNVAKLVGVQPSTVSRWFPEGLPYTDSNTSMTVNTDTSEPHDEKLQKEAMDDFWDLNVLTKYIDKVLNDELSVRSLT